VTTELTDQTEEPELVGTKENTATQWAAIQEIEAKMGLRRWLMATPEMIEELSMAPLGRKLVDVASLMMYGIEHPGTRRKLPMNVPETVAKWKEVIVAYCTAHSKEDFEQADYQMDALFGPLLTAPVTQLREFYRDLVGQLKADPQVPFMIWQSFEKWGVTVLDKAQDDGVVELKTALATQIAKMVETKVTPDIMEAIAGALQWRSLEQLEAVKGALEGGAKPRLTGRQSCLYLEIGEGDEAVKVML